jgi:vacuolar-type H+-ATPase subunit I/STV1
VRTVTRVAVLACLLFATPAYSSTFGDVIDVFFKTTQSILLGGRDLFALLKTEQVLRVTDELSSQAADLDEKKKELRHHIEKDDQLNIEPEIDALIGQVNKFTNTLNTFAHEIDQVGHDAKVDLHVDDLRQASTRLVHHKVQELAEIKAEVHKSRPDRELILKKLDEAIADSTKLRLATRCLYRTLLKQELQCDPQTFQPKT